MTTSNQKKGDHPMTTRMTKSEAKKEIVAEIIFYQGRGWDWWPLVSFLIEKANRDL